MDEPFSTLKVLIRRNISQLLFIFGAFFLMVLLGSLLVNRILRSRLLEGAEAALFTAEANIKSGLAEAEVTLINSYHVVRVMVNDGASQDDLKVYLENTTRWMRERDGLLGFYGIYGYIRGQFIDSVGFNPGDDYIPQRRPWYQTAIRIGNGFAFTAPYTDAQTGSTIISAVKNLDAPDETVFGILVADVNISWLNDYVRSLRLAPGGYGLTLSRNMALMNHPNTEYMGMQLQGLGGDFPRIARALMANENVYGKIIRDRDGTKLIVFFRQMFNGWYVGLITPYGRFFRDMVYAAVALSQLGFILAFVLSVVLLRINAAKMKSDEENRQKSTFLAQMSHEIRTPMNAIIGISEITLREEISSRVAENIGSIKQAGNNLLAIINDILDFSRIESGKLEIVPTEYLFSSLINDCISIIRTRLVDKPVHLITRIDGTLPSRLYGDEVRLRQVLLNILSNAVKYTNNGHIVFTVRSEAAVRPAAGDRVDIIFEVADTGIGIRPENMTKLFGQFTRFAESESPHIEGTGLGLAITKNLCQLMGGDINAESEYGVGSVFRMVLPQVVRDPAPLAAVEAPETKPTLIFETRREYAEAMMYSVSNLGVSCTLAESRADFIVELVNGDYQFVIVSSVCFRDIREILADVSVSANKDVRLFLLADYGEEIDQKTIKAVFMPVQPQVLAQLFNNELENAQDTPLHRGMGVRFTAPDCRILVVDDVYSNLVVAEGLLAPYKLKVDSSQSGESAIALVEKHPYDLVFMDHMMPGMDGIEATARIRALSRSFAAKMPIVALTANAVSGMKEMFLENGFTDYLSKPIDLAKLDEILVRWLPRHKQQRERSSPGRTVPAAAGAPPSPALTLLASVGVNIIKGLSLTGGREKEYLKVLSAFYRDVLARQSLFADIMSASRASADAPEQLNLFVISVHALKSASGTIGADTISREAAELEAAGKAGDRVLIVEKLPAFRSHLTDITDTLGVILGVPSGAAPAGSAMPEENFRDAEFEKARPLFQALKAALENENISDIDAALDTLEDRSFNPELAERVAGISDRVLMSEFAEALGMVTAITGEGGAGQAG
jgi:signal transduction histidine kinase/CheY-like chemotaxis protein